MYNSLMRFNLKKNEKKLRFRGFEAVRGLIPHIFLVRPGGHMCPPITLCCFFSSEFKLAKKNFFGLFSNASFSLVNKDMTDIYPLS